MTKVNILQRSGFRLWLLYTYTVGSLTEADTIYYEVANIGRDNDNIATGKDNEEETEWAFKMQQKG